MEMLPQDLPVCEQFCSLGIVPTFASSSGELSPISTAKVEVPVKSIKLFNPTWHPTIGFHIHFPRWPASIILPAVRGSSTWQDRVGREMDIKNLPRLENLIQTDSWKVDARKEWSWKSNSNVFWKVDARMNQLRFVSLRLASPNLQLHQVFFGLQIWC